MNTSAIIVCAGNSSRMQGVNKILLPLGKTNVIGCTLTAFQKCESITDIVVVCRCQDEERLIVLVLQNFTALHRAAVPASKAL